MEPFDKFHIHHANGLLGLGNVQTDDIRTLLKFHNPNLTGIVTTGNGNFLSVPGEEWFIRKFTFFVSGNNPGLCDFEFQVSCQYKELDIEAMFVQKYALVPAATYIKQRYIEEMVETKRAELMAKYLPMAQTPCDGNLESPT